MYTLYKLQSKTGHWYVGATSDLRRRIRDHFSKIRSLLKYDEYLSINKKNLRRRENNKPCIHSRFTYEVAYFIHRAGHKRLDKAIERAVTVIVLATSESREEIAQMESETIKNGDKMMTNVMIGLSFMYFLNTKQKNTIQC